MPKHTGHKLNGHVPEAGSSFSQNPMQKSSTARIYEDVILCMFLNMDETAVLF